MYRGKPVHGRAVTLDLPATSDLGSGSVELHLTLTGISTRFRPTPASSAKRLVRLCMLRKYELYSLFQRLLHFASGFGLCFLAPRRALSD